ncbi:MAG: TonB-dependent receptor [Salinivirgaceae bacterium]|jgi:TonB-linked SusC/RagA family outer membrane protein|nr:TonB-dependent receptor [Salinivirgaceae bacterium]
MKKKLFLITAALFLFNALTFAQQTTVKGTVTASDGFPLPGASVIIKGTTTGTVTDFDGNYSLEIQGVSDPILIFSFIGYLSEELPVGNQGTIDIVLTTDISDLDEVVVVGYGVQKKSLVTGAISKISSEDLIATQPQRVEQAIQGKVSGVTVSAESGSPGAGMTIKIRGTGSNNNSNPLYIVDGMKTSGIDYLDPSDIESIEILKDAASAAIYGAEGGNGVVLISTKKGKKGMAQVTYSNYFGQQYYNDNFKVMDADQYIDYYQKAFLYQNKYIRAKDATEDEQIAKTNKDLLKAGFPAIGEAYDGFKTDWLDEVTAPAFMQSHNVGISGGTEKSTYASSVNYFDQNGITGGDKSHFKRMTARLNMEHQATDYLKVGIKATYSRRERSSLGENSEFTGLYGNAILIDPLTPTVYASEDDIPSEYTDVEGASELFVRDGSGNAYGMSTKARNKVANPLALIETSHGSWGEDKILAGAFVDISPIEGLNFRSSYDLDIANSQQESWTPAYYYHNESESSFSTADQRQNNYRTWQFDNVLSYTKSFVDHNISAMVGTHAEEYTRNELSGWGKNMVREADAFSHPASTLNFPSDADLKVTVSGVDTTVIYTTPVTADAALGGERYDPRRLASVFGRFSYNYMEKYMLNITIRNDKSSMLSPQADPDGGTFQSGLFPSVSMGWVISKENFWTIPMVNFLKVRYSYGTNGNLSSVTPYQYVGVIGYNGFPYTDGVGTILQGASPLRLSNESLGWETSIMHNVGLDFRLLESKVSGTVEYFNRITSDLLDEAITPGYVGNEKPYANEGKISNSGLELELSYKQLEGDFQWELGGNISFMKNEVTSYPGGRDGAGLGIGNAVTRIEEGQPVYFLYGFETDGMWRDIADVATNNIQIDSEGNVIMDDATGEPKQKQLGAVPGDIKIVDVDGDGVITTEDRTNIGSPHPKVLAGLNFNAYYKNFDFGINFTGAFGQKVYNGIYRTDVGYSNRPAHFLEDAWSPENPDADYPAPSISSAWNFKHNDTFVENGSYVKLRNLTLGYTLPKDLMQAANITSMRVYFSANNLLTITKYKGVDPEMGNTATDQDGNAVVSSYGVDRGFYPQARQFLVGLNVTF